LRGKAKDNVGVVTFIEERCECSIAQRRFEGDRRVLRSDNATDSHRTLRRLKFQLRKEDSDGDIHLDSCEPHEAF